MTNVFMFTVLSGNLEMGRNVIRKGKRERYLKLDFYPESKFKQIRSQRKLNKQGTPTSGFKMIVPQLLRDHSLILQLIWGLWVKWGELTTDTR